MRGAFATIVGVYYGSRTAESATESAAASARQIPAAVDGGGGGENGDGEDATKQGG